MSICHPATETNQDRFLCAPCITPVDFRSEPRKRRLAHRTSDYQVSSKPLCLRSGQQKALRPYRWLFAERPHQILVGTIPGFKWMGFRKVWQTVTSGYYQPPLDTSRVLDDKAAPSSHFDDGHEITEGAAGGPHGVQRSIPH